MSANNDGGPAYPYTLTGQTDICGRSIRDVEFPGMTMRQAYKLAALQGMYSNSGLVDNFSAHESMVKEASRVADAMLAEDVAHASRKGGEK